MRGDQNVYWAVSDSNGQLRLVAECGKCLDGGSCDCSVTDRDFRVTRTATSSDLQIVGNTRQKDGDTLKCSKGDNLAHAQCTLKTKWPDYRKYLSPEILYVPYK